MKIQSIVGTVLFVLVTGVVSSSCASKQDDLANALQGELAKIPTGSATFDDTPVVDPALCPAREKDMKEIYEHADGMRGAAENWANSGRHPEFAQSIRQSVQDFDTKYKGLACNGTETNDSFETRINATAAQVEQLNP